MQNASRNQTQGTLPSYILQKSQDYNNPRANNAIQLTRRISLFTKNRNSIKRLKTLFPFFFLHNQKELRRQKNEEKETGIDYQRGLRGGNGGDSERRAARRWRRGQGFSANALAHVPNSDLF